MTLPLGRNGIKDIWVKTVLGQVRAAVRSRVMLMEPSYLGREKQSLLFSAPMERWVAGATRSRVNALCLA